VRLGAAHADASIAASFLPGMGRRIPNRIQPQ
jgi:hydroxymethylpyrimidine/phosphomethylpyrimidine kinase